MEFDHVFICVAEPADEAEQLVDFGLVEGTSNHHPGQGTANRRFFFQNAFIEVLFPTDSTELDNELTGPTNLHERFPPKAHHVSPFGVCFRPSNSESNVLFENWSYRPPYLPEHLDVKVARSPTTEPMWFYLSFMLGECNNEQPAHEIGDHSYFAYIEVKDAEALHEEFKQKDIEFIKQLTDEAWGMREFGIKTVDGHRMMFGEDLDK